MKAFQISNTSGPTVTSLKPCQN